MRPHFNNTGVETQEASIPTTKNKTKRDFKAIYRRGIASSYGIHHSNKKQTIRPWQNFLWGGPHHLKTGDV